MACVNTLNQWFHNNGQSTELRVDLHEEGLHKFLILRLSNASNGQMLASSVIHLTEGMMAVMNPNWIMNQQAQPAYQPVQQPSWEEQQRDREQISMLQQLRSSSDAARAASEALADFLKKGLDFKKTEDGLWLPRATPDSTVIVDKPGSPEFKVFDVKEQAYEKIQKKKIVVETDPCICDIKDICVRGCKCGAIERERAAKKRAAMEV